MTQLTLGSLFDGIGGFPLAGIYAGMKPIWASEIEPFPIRVTRKRLPFMRHYGDIHKLYGKDLEPVDVITFGSPCQNLSVAGKRAGLQGEQSSLFFEAVRIIKEMRYSSHGQYPKWAVWENVPGALSSCDGQDFRTVLEQLIRIKEPQADVPLPEKWLAAGEILGNDYSLAWRILDASKGWGVAQRRKRIFVVIHFDDEEDEYLEGLIAQAQTAAEDYCRVSFEPYLQPNEDGEEVEVSVPEPVRLALLLFVGFYYENRDIPDMTTYKAMRMAFDNLLYPYRDPAKMF